MNNAGRSHVGAAKETGEAEQRALFEVHFFGPAALTRAALPHLRAPRSGVIVQVSSMEDDCRSRERPLPPATPSADFSCSPGARLEDGRTFLLECGDAFLHLRPGESEEFERQSSVEMRSGSSQPGIERLFGPAQCGGSTAREPDGDVGGLVEHLTLVDRE
ncbi:hypothetical protein B1L11_27145 [Microbispora sp. GKU 823]|nr:hypothetical protein B1L11_27145 [Microbispora sp. GKU 823]